MRLRWLVGVFLVLAAGCPSPSVDDDDTVVADDDDSVVDDDDSVVDDDDSVVDDDDAVDDDDSVAPSTTLTILSPTNGETLEVIHTFRAQIDGDAPGLATFRLNGSVVHQGFFNVATGVVSAQIDTGEYPDGTYTFEVEATSWGLTDSVDVTFTNGDLLVYDTISLPYVYEAISPQAYPLEVVPSGVSLTHMVAPAAGSPFQGLFGYALNPNSDWAIGGPATTLYPVESAVAAPWAGVIPNHPEIPWVTGAYNLYPWADASGDGFDFEVTPLVKRSFGAVEAGLLSVDFYFGPGVTMNASTAQGSAVFANFLDALEGLLLQADIALGDIGYFDVTGSSFNSIGSYEELTDLFAQGVASTDRVLSVFFVNGLSLPNSNPLGIAAHIPGPALMNGTGQAGVALVDDYLQSNEPATHAAVTAHEMGHYLGLYHPSEVGGSPEDPLGDTAASCNASNCFETNLMDPYLNNNTSLTADQRWVMLRHPLVELVPASSLPARSAEVAFDYGAGLPEGGVAGFCGM